MSGPGPVGTLAPDFLLRLFRDPLDSGYAAAARRRGGAPPPKRDRLWSVVALLVVGALLAVAYRQVVAHEPVRAQTRAQLVEQIHDREAVAERLERRAAELRDEVTRLRDEQLASEEVRRLRELEAVTGLAPVRGPGVVVRVADGSQVDPVTGQLVPEARVLDYDLQQITNALWAAGAEAVAINGRRLTATSTIRGVSGAILVNRVPVTGPYEVVAVGPEEMQRRFESAGVATTLRALSERYGISYEVRAARDLTLPAGVPPEFLNAGRAGTSGGGG